MKILAASSNTHKIRELTAVAAEFGINIVSPGQLQNELKLTYPPTVDETGLTYQENALLKAQAYCQWSGKLALGDDSGLEIEILGGKPGLYSARYGGEGLSDRERVSRVLAEVMEEEKRIGKRNRRAYFRCSLALVYPEGMKLFADSSLAGEVLDVPRGELGFGYDPIIFLPSIGATLAEVDFEITCAQGFRAIAARKLFKALKLVPVHKVQFRPISN